MAYMTKAELDDALRRFYPGASPHTFCSQCEAMLRDDHKPDADGKHRCDGCRTLRMMAAAHPCEALMALKAAVEEERHRASVIANGGGVMGRGSHEAMAEVRTCDLFLAWIDALPKEAADATG